METNQIQEQMLIESSSFVTTFINILRQTTKLFSFAICKRKNKGIQSDLQYEETKQIRKQMLDKSRSFVTFI